MPVKGRAYTMKELKGIVEYLVEHKAYGEVRGRKMWLDYASTGFTSRTWQSLKETFLKRILPDIHNPYYKLSKEEIRSFRMGIEILPANNGETTSKDNNRANGEPSTSYNVTKEEGNTSGEEYQVSKVTSSRESVETVILSTDECYNNAQDLIKVLESPGSSPQTSPKKTLSLRDCITYSEPLTPMLQEIIDDFETDAEDHVFEPEVILETGKEGPKTEEEKQKGKTNTECIDLTTQEEMPKVMKGGEGPDEKEKINSNEDGAPDECIDLTTQEEAQEMVKEGEVLNDKKKINGNENDLSEAAEKTTKMSLRLKKGAKDKTKNISTETSNLLFLSNISVFHNTLSGQEVENTVPEEVNKEDLSKTNEKAKSLSTDTNESDVLEVQNTEPEEEVDTTKKCGSEAPEAVNEDNVSKIDKKKGLKDTILDEGNKDEASKTNNTTESNLVITNGSDVQVIENGITGNVNKKSAVGDKTHGNKKEINQENDENMNKTNLETQDTQKPMEHSSSTVTDSLIPNNQEALLNRPDDKESPEKHDPKTQEPEKVGKITTKRDSKAKSVEKTIKKTEKQNRKLFSKSQKRQRKLYSTTESIALAEVKRTTLDGVSEHVDNEKPGISEKLQKSLTKFLNKKSSKDNKHLKPAAETSKDPDETQHEDVIDTQESYPTLTRILNEKSSKDLKFTEDNTNEGKHPKPPAETSKEPDEIQHDDILDTQESHQSTNPCLQSVSLFDEQFLLLKSDSDNETTTEDKPTGNTEKEKLATKNSKKKPKENIVQEVIDTRNRESTSVESNNDACLISNQNNVVILKSHSESETTEDIQPTSRKRTHRDISRNQKKEVLNDLFGNTSGTVSKKRQRNPSYRNGSAHRKNITESSESSEWVSESDGEYVSPPRARHRQSKRYLRPQSSRLLQMQQEGALFVAVGRKVYPLVRDDGLAVNYVNYVSGSESEEDDSYWKLKYVKERKKNEQLAKQLEKANDECADKIIRPALFDSPILPTTSSKKPRRISINDDVKSNEEVKGTELVPIKEKEEPKGETVKIKYAKNNEEIFVEGPWQNVHTILSDVMQVFKRDSISLPEATKKNAANTPSERVSSRNTLSNSVVQKKGASPVIEVSSGKTTPLNGVVDEEIRKKVELLERKIFEEIEEKDKSEVNLQVPKEVLVFERENNLQISEEDHGTEKRKRGRPKNLASNPNSPLPSTVGSSKRTKTSSETESVTNNNNKRAIRNAKPSIDSETAPPERKSRQAKAAEARLEREAKSPSEGGSRTDSEIIVNESRLHLIEDVPGRSRRRPKPPAKLSYDNAEPSPKQKNLTIPEDDSQILYKFPSPPSATLRASRSKK